MMDKIGPEGCMISISVVIIAAVLAFVAWVSKATCEAKTANIGYPARWELIGGCLIEVKEDQWIPLEQYYFKEE